MAPALLAAADIPWHVDLNLAGKISLGTTNVVAFDPKLTKKNMDGDEACDMCKRKLSNPRRYHLCYFACKVQASYKKNNHVKKPRVTTRMTAKEKDEVEQTTNINKSMRVKWAEGLMGTPAQPILARPIMGSDSL
ncbi:Uncharacterized protein Adt_40859 [Abeliophyllum distichum]|uniref:Uncharacterized protein n=1 Tax=Abeliophyllum distichum TaxID=126358 RepID=A0ABD1PNR1_9LAMI